VPPDVPEYFIPCRGQLAAGSRLLYRPALLGLARLHYVDKTAGIDHWETLALLRPIGEEVPWDVWDGAKVHSDGIPELDKMPEAGASFAPLPGALSRASCYVDWTKALKNYLYRDRKLTIWFCPVLMTFSRPSETQRDFRLRLAQRGREERDQALELLRPGYASLLDSGQERIRTARKQLGNARLAAKAGRTFRPRSDVGKAQADLDAALENFTKLELEIQEAIETIKESYTPELLRLTPIELTPKKSDITIEQVVLAWTPCQTIAGAQPEAGRITDASLLNRTPG
jgi:hypothetical protein